MICPEPPDPVVPFWFLNHKIKKTNIFLNLIIYTPTHKTKTRNIFLNLMIYTSNHKMKTRNIFLNLMTFILYHTWLTTNILLNLRIYLQKGISQIFLTLIIFLTNDMMQITKIFLIWKLS